MHCAKARTTSGACDKDRIVVNSDSELIELTSPDDPDDASYPSEPSVAGDLMRHLADQLLAARYIDDEILYRIWDNCERRDIPPIVRRYYEARRGGTPSRRLRVNDKGLAKYSTAKSYHYIELILGNASENADRLPGGMDQVKRDVADYLGISVSTVQRYWTDIKSAKKRRPGRPKKIGKK